MRGLAGDVLLLQGQGFTLRHPYAEFHEVVTGDGSVTVCSTWYGGLTSRK